MRERGMCAVFWVINKPSDVKHVISNITIDGIMSDCPLNIKPVLLPGVKKRA